MRNKNFLRRIFGASIGLSGCLVAAHLNSLKVEALQQNDDKIMSKPTTISLSNSYDYPDRKILLNGYELKMVQILFRHGARTPLHVIKNVDQVSYDKDLFTTDLPHTIFKFRKADLNGGDVPPSSYEAQFNDLLLKGGARRGTLTKTGQDQMYMIGRLLRKQYVDEAGFIDAIYNPSQIYVRSTNINRTIESARCLLAGLFGNLNLNNSHHPVCIHVQEANNDVLIPMVIDCLVLRQLNHLAMVHGGDLPEVKEHRLILEQLLEIDPDGTPGKKNINFVEVRDDIVAREVHGMAYPSMLHEHRQMIEKNACMLLYYAFCGHNEAYRPIAIKLSTGPVLKMLLDNIEVADSNPTKLYILCCHDSTLVGLLGALEIYDFNWPPFGADLRMELYENEQKEKFVRVSYVGKDQKLPGCKSELCSLADFKAWTQNYVIDRKNFMELCSSNILEMIDKESIEQEKNEVEDEEDKKRSETPAGM